MKLLNDLEKIIDKKNILTKDVDKAYAQKDQSTNVIFSMPLLVVMVDDVKDLIEVVRLLIKHRTPLLVRGAGSGKSGGAVPDNQTVVIDITRLNRFSIDKDNLLALAEPGVLLGDLQAAALKENLYYPPDPASALFCTLGGNVAENAAGPSTIKYGTTRDYFLGGQAIIGTGEIIDFGKHGPKGVAGYDVASLLCGSEGTLGIFTKLILRLLPKPLSQAAAVYYFTDEEEALFLVNIILQQGHRPKTLEYVDSICLFALKKLLGLTIPNKAQAALIIECDASYEGGANKQIELISKLLRQHAQITVKQAFSDEERLDIWQQRSMLSEACTKLTGYKISEDIAVPLGALASFQKTIKQLASKNVKCGLFGHAGDGNLHVQIMYDHPKFRAMAEDIRHKILLLVVSLKGTIAAEHGIGLQKKAYLGLEQSAQLIELQKRIKRAFDPYNLLNPAKIFDV